jgi:hypothetical protein
MFEAPVQALPRNFRPSHKRPVRFLPSTIRIIQSSGSGRYKSHNPIFKARVALAKGFDSAIVPTILLKCCARNLNDSFMFWAGVRIIDQEDAGVE